MNKGKVVRVTVLAVSLLMLTWYIAGVINAKVLYKRGVYDCSDMSQDQKAIFDFLGFDTDYIGGVRVNRSNATDWSLESAHLWLVIHIGDYDIYWESTQLAFKPLSYYKEKYECIQVEEPPINYISRTFHRDDYIEYYGNNSEIIDEITY